MSAVVEILARLITVIKKLQLWLRSKIKASPRLMTAYELLTYDLKNREIFDDLYQHKMLADKARLDSYARAIRKYVKEGDTVVDLGTGSGILALHPHESRGKSSQSITLTS